MSLSIHDREYSSLHFAGVLGAGMSALAQYVRWAGCDVSGSDRTLGSSTTSSVSDFLTSIGCRLFDQDGSGVSLQTSAVVVSSAIEESNPDIVKANQLEIPIFHRSDVLSAIIRTKKTIAVAGTSGKSTVTAMIFHLLQECGVHPSLITGAGLKSLQQKGFPGNALYQNGKWLVVEADESDGSLVKYHPHIALFLNVSKDHKTVPETIELFSTLAEQAEIVVKNGDEDLFDSIKADYTFGRKHSADFRMESPETTAKESAFVYHGLRFRTSLPGMHNADNLFASVVSALLCDCSEKSLRDAAETFQGLHRRFSIFKTSRNIMVIDDYAHNPEKIRAAVSAAQALCHRAFVLFQPHGFGPMRFMREDLVSMFRETLRADDQLYLLPIYYAGGNVMRDISSSDLAADLQGTSFQVHAPETRRCAADEVISKVCPGDVILSMGARDPSLDAYAQEIAKRVEALSAV